LSKPKKNILTHDQARHIYHELVLPRAIEERMLKLLRQNKIAKWFSGIGQEAIAVGATMSMHNDDVIMPMHRNLGVSTTRRVDFYRLFCQLFGKADGFTEGRERSFHFGIPEYNIIGMISHLGAMLPVADGIALASKLRGQNRVVLSFSGDGGTSEGDFHEAVNLAAVWGLPVIFLIENNGYGLSTPTREQFVCDSLADRAKGYGIKGYSIDGNNVTEVMDTVSKLRGEVLNNGMPVILEARTFRMRGHEEASGTAYVPDELMKEWAEKDPIKRFGERMIADELLTEDDLVSIRKAAESLYSSDLERALTADYPIADTNAHMARVYAPTPEPQAVIGAATKEARYLDGIRDALHQRMTEDPEMVIIGQDIAEYGGVFKITDGFLGEFGKERIRNTPIIESGAIGAAMGLALEGISSIVEMQFADFVSCGYNQIVNNLAISHYRWSPPLSVTIRLPYGGGVGAGPYHSQCPEGWFMQHPGLKIAVPATVEDAQLLTYSALIDPNPVLVFEHKKLYRGLKGHIHEKAWYEPFGKARVHREGLDMTIVTYGMGVHWATAAAEAAEVSNGISIEVIDLRTLVPFDLETVLQSVRKTGRVLLLQEPSITLGPSSEWAALIAEHGFQWLDAPVVRCASLDTPVPTSTSLEADYLASSRLPSAIDRLLRY
jgi:2-oxoisovalerate dehydrogenase E1 component